MKVISGSCGKKSPSDALVSIDLNQDYIQIEIISKYKEMFGSHIENAVLEVLESEAITKAKVIVEDDGALDFVIKARLRTAIRRVKGYEKA